MPEASTIWLGGVLVWSCLMQPSNCEIGPKSAPSATVRSVSDLRAYSSQSRPVASAIITMMVSARASRSMLSSNSSSLIGTSPLNRLVLRVTRPVAGREARALDAGPQDAAADRNARDLELRRQRGLVVRFLEHDALVDEDAQELARLLRREQPTAGRGGHVRSLECRLFEPPKQHVLSPLAQLRRSWRSGRRLFDPCRLLLSEHHVRERHSTLFVLADGLLVLVDLLLPGRHDLLDLGLLDLRD